VSNNSSIVVCVFIATGMNLLSHCLAIIRGHGKQANSSGTVEGGVFSAAQAKLINNSLLRTVVTGQSQCARTRDLEGLISGPTILAFRDQG
jgi:hypothetical protein